MTKMAYEIVKVHTEPYNSEHESDITKVKLANYEELSVADVVDNIDEGSAYYFTAKNGRKPEVESVHPTGRDPYIRTKANDVTSDNLLSLDRF
ncbi:hypothetical protein FC74_GL002603 [Lacticaseibacillus paracasei subsp. paracasei ATCC 25302 = DSM 5622 = JCM 8130]|nr:hypothetical protein FC74_GL002603 [Lacticaseibacillus paracasei subsp. paracasei ATCC 25302 = DSM 5622 = JCM 8130]